MSTILGAIHEERFSLAREIELFNERELEDYPNEMDTTHDVTAIKMLPNVCNEEEFNFWKCLFANIEKSGNLEKKEKLRRLMWLRIGAVHLNHSETLN